MVSFFQDILKLDGKVHVDYINLTLKGEVWAGEKIFVSELLRVFNIYVIYSSSASLQNNIFVSRK